MDPDEFRVFSMSASGDEAVQRAADHGVDLYHVFLHLYETAVCMLGSERALDAGVFVQLTDLKDRTWTFSVVPEDGGLVSKGLLEAALEGDRT